MLPGSIVSADSHVAETEDAYRDIDPRYRDERPRNVTIPGMGAAIEIPGIELRMPFAFASAAGRDPALRYQRAMGWEEIMPASYSSGDRLAIQDQEGIRAELIFPTAGMLIAGHPDHDYRKACFDAYNRWLAEYCSKDPSRLIGVAQIVARTVDEGVAELEAAKGAGFRAIMMFGEPIVPDYDQPNYDAFWEACVDLDLPVNFHILTSKKDIDVQRARRGPAICNHQRIIRGNQDLLSQFVFGGVFDRHPKLRIVMAESDAAWIPHFGNKMDHAWTQYRFREPVQLQRWPSEYLSENVYYTMQDDMPVARMTDILPMDRILWASDFPHADGTYPNSRKVLEEMAATMSADDLAKMTHDNVARLYGLAV